MILFIQIGLVEIKTQDDIVLRFIKQIYEITGRMNVYMFAKVRLAFKYNIIKSISQLHHSLRSKKYATDANTYTLIKKTTPHPYSSHFTWSR